MDILLIAGKLNNTFYSKISYKKHIINKQEIYSSQIIELVDKNNITFDKILILDEGIDESISDFINHIEELINQKRVKEIVIATSNLEIKWRLRTVKVYFNEAIRTTNTFYFNCMEEIISEKVEPRQIRQKESDGYDEKIITRNEPSEESRKPKESIFKKVFSRNKSIKEDESQEFKHVSKGISRVIGITGHRGVGITSTLVNLGYEASKRNLKTIIVDLDIRNRTINLYFSEFIRQSEQDEHLRASLVKCLAKPQDYKSNACCIKDKLWVTELSYDFEDKRLINQFYISNKLINMLAVLRQYFNIILLDIPLEVLGEFEECIPNIDVFGLCTHNSQYSIITNLRNMGTYLSNESITYLNAKSKLIITQYNDRAQYEGDFFTSDKVSEIYNSDLCEELSIRMSVAGTIKYTNEFDEQIENDIPIVEQNSEYKNYYSNILLRLLEAMS